MPSHPRSYRIGFVAEAKEDFAIKGWTSEEMAEFESLEDIHENIDSIRSLGHEVDYVPNIEGLMECIADGTAKQWDFVWNITEGTSFNEGREAQVPGLLEAFKIPCSFSDAATHTLSMNKAKTKMVFDYHGVPTAPFAVVPRHGKWSGVESVARSPHRDAMPYPLFVKPACEGNSRGVHNDSRATDDASLNRVVEKIKNEFTEQDIIIERFLDGRDFTVLIVGTREKARVVGALELRWKKGIIEGKCPMPDPNIIWTSVGKELVKGAVPVPEDLKGGEGVDTDVFDWQLKSTTWGWDFEPFFTVECDLKDPVIQEVADVALQAYLALDCFDCARVDVRHDRYGAGARPNVLEINTLPGMIPTRSCLAMITEMAGKTHAEIMGEIIDSVAGRYNGFQKVTNGVH